MVGFSSIDHHKMHCIPLLRYFFLYLLFPTLFQIKRIGLIDALYGTLIFLYTHLCNWRGPSLYLRIAYIVSQMNKKYPKFFPTWFNKFSLVPYSGSYHMSTSVRMFHKWSFRSSHPGSTYPSLLSMTPQFGEAKEMLLHKLGICRRRCLMLWNKLGDASNLQMWTSKCALCQCIVTRWSSICINED